MAPLTPAFSISLEVYAREPPGPGKGKIEKLGVTASGKRVLLVSFPTEQFPLWSSADDVLVETPGEQKENPIVPFSPEVW